MLNHMSGRNLCPHYWLVPVVAIVAVVLLWPGQALAETLEADCSTDNLQDVIDSFQDKTVSNTLVITGLCTNPIGNRTVREDCDAPGQNPEGPWPLHQGEGGVCRGGKA